MIFSRRQLRKQQHKQATENRFPQFPSTKLRPQTAGDFAAFDIDSPERTYEGGLLFWREMLLNMMKAFDTISFVRALGTKGKTKGDMTKTVNKHVKCRQHFSPEKKAPSYIVTDGFLPTLTSTTRNRSRANVPYVQKSVLTHETTLPLKQGK